jgi:hypothetical protein
MGFSVVELHEVGEGVPDLLIGWQGRNMLYELKNTADGWLTEDQKKFFNEWQGHKKKVHSIEAILQDMTLYFEDQEAGIELNLMYAKWKEGMV